MTTTSTIINPVTGQPYKVGDVLETKEQAIAFAKTVGWEFCFYFSNRHLLKDSQGDSIGCLGDFSSDYMPYTIVGFLPHHVATATPNPPLTADECMNGWTWTHDPSRPHLLPEKYNNGNTACEYHQIVALQATGLCFYKYKPTDPDTKPTERAE